MGSGEYGGNGSIHWKLKHGHGRTINCNGNASADGIDDDPTDTGGYFNVEIDDVSATDFSYNSVTKTLTAKTLIKHGNQYTKQVTIKWP
jgi:hypothetical protein